MIRGSPRYLVEMELSLQLIAIQTHSRMEEGVGIGSFLPVKIPEVVMDIFTRAELVPE